MADSLHCVRINPSTAKRAKSATAAEYESFPAGRPSVVSEESWQTMQQGVKLGAPCASKKQKVDCVYINLDSRPDRNESIEAELSREGASRAPPRLHIAAVHSPTAPCVWAGIKAKRLSALTGADAPDAVVSRTWDTTVNAKYDPTTIKTGRVSLTPGERGCSMSHAVLWARCAAQGDSGPPLLVVEDDLILKDGAGEMVQKLVTHFEKTNPIPAQRLCLLYLTGDVAEWRHPRSQSVESCPQVKLREAEYIWQTACYVIWPAAARRLLASLPVDGPVDNFISRHTLSSHVCALVTQPKLAWQNAPYEEGDIAHSGHVSNKRVRATKDSMSSPTKTKKHCDEAASPGTHLMHHLGELPGIGPKLAQTLRKHARTLPGGLVEANQLEGIPGLGAKRQADIVRYLQLKTTNSP
tara:strand:- start:891 stop:2123 length:1233 start_codon:yes stop_codon:yes gene_type:complete